jgi:hypothetical protein
MESFESVVALVLEAEGFVVSGAVKFPVSRRTAKAMHKEVQTHGYEVDLVAARADVLVLATVKSFFGSRGVAAEDVAGGSRFGTYYKLLNDSFIRDEVIAAAAKRYGYRKDRIQAPLKPRPPTQVPATAPPGFALPEKRGGLLGGKQNRVPADTGGSMPRP